MREKLLVDGKQIVVVAKNNGELLKWATVFLCALLKKKTEQKPLFQGVHR